MEVVILGSASNGGIPQSNCLSCRACKAALEKGGYNRRTRSSIVIRNKENYTLVDAGPDLRQQLQRERIRMNQISKIFQTHTHFDHVAGLFETSVGRKLQIPVYSKRKILDLIFEEGKSFNYLSSENWVIEKELEIEKKMKIDDITVVAFEVPHTPAPLGPTLGYKFFQNGKILVYIPDIAEITDDMTNSINGSDVLILDGTFYETPGYGHIAIKPTIPALQKLDIGKVYFTHINHTEPLHEELEKSLEPYGYSIAYDGMKIKI